MVTRSAKRRAESYQQPAEAREIAPVDTVSTSNQMVTKGAKRRAISYQKPAHEAGEIAPIIAKKNQKKNRKRGPKKIVLCQFSHRYDRMKWCGHMSVDFLGGQVSSNRKQWMESIPFTSLVTIVDTTFIRKISNTSWRGFCSMRRSPKPQNCSTKQRRRRKFSFFQIGPHDVTFAKC